jgi:hypothetical protein
MRTETLTIRIRFDRIAGVFRWYLLDSRKWPVDSGEAENYLPALDAARKRLAEINP